jgi:hypothetical protein
MHVYWENAASIITVAHISEKLAAPMRLFAVLRL